MKKLFTAMLAVTIILTMAISASAATAFENVAITATTELFDDPATMDQGGNGTTISYMEAYGVGNSSLNDMVIFRGVDFGANGADKMFINFSYGNNDDTATAIEVYLDKAEGTPIATYAIGFTGGWEITLAQEFEATVAILGGVHDIFVKFASEKSGSFSSVRFNEAPAAAVEVVAEENANPETADLSVIFYALSSLSVLGAATTLIKRKK